MFLLKSFVDPLPWLIGAGALWLMAIRRRLSRTQLIVAMSGLVLAYALSVRPLEAMLLPLVETGCPVTLPSRDIDAVVVLGAGVSRDAADGQAEMSAESAARLMMGVRVWRSAAAPRLVLAGGSASPAEPAEAEVMAAAARQAGVPTDAMLLDTVSLNTREHARSLRGRSELEHARLALVTSATHMRRSMMAFAASFAAIQPVPVGCLDAPTTFTLAQLVPNVDRLGRVQAVLYELVGLVWYSLRGLP